MFLFPRRGGTPGRPPKPSPYKGEGVTRSVTDEGDSLSCTFSPLSTPSPSEVENFPLPQRLKGQPHPQPEPPGKPHWLVRLPDLHGRAPDAVKLRRTGRQLLQALGPGSGQVYGLLLFRRYGTLMLLL